MLNKWIILVYNKYSGLYLFPKCVLRNISLIRCIKQNSLEVEINSAHAYIHILKYLSHKLKKQTCLINPVFLQNFGSYNSLLEVTLMNKLTPQVSQHYSISFAILV